MRSKIKSYYSKPKKSLILNYHVFKNLAKFLKVKELLKLQRTCKVYMTPDFKVIIEN